MLGWILEIKQLGDVIQLMKVQLMKILYESDLHSLSAEQKKKRKVKAFFTFRSGCTSKCEKLPYRISNVVEK